MTQDMRMKPNVLIIREPRIRLAGDCLQCSIDVLPRKAGTRPRLK
jgi:hypothetical protein